MTLRLILPALMIASLAALAAAPATAGDPPSCPSGCAGKSAKDIVDTAVAAGSFTTLAKALEAADLVGVLKGDGPFTVFAPTDEAFDRLPAGTIDSLLADKARLREVLTYHVVSGRVPASAVARLSWADTLQGQSVHVESDGDGVRIDGARVLTADVPASNGIIHVIDRVLLPRKDIVDTAVEAGSFQTLVTAVKAADLVETLKGKGPFTVFAPADSAFAALDEGTIPALLADKARLRSVLTYHVVPGRILSTDLAVGSADVATVQGSSAKVVRSKDGTVTIDGARVVKADIIVGNGVIHVIDRVILPNAQ
jgi:transforming growth factor-beta-induced protein